MDPYCKETVFDRICLISTRDYVRNTLRKHRRLQNSISGKTGQSKMGPPKGPDFLSILTLAMH